MKIHAFATCFFCYCFLSCSGQDSKRRNARPFVAKACILSDIPSFNVHTRELYHYSDSIVIYSFGDFNVLNMYKLNRFYTVYENGDSSEMRLSNEMKRWSYFVYRSDDGFGAYYDSAGSSPALMNVDSFFKKNIPRFQLNDSIELNWNSVSTVSSGSVLEKTFVAKQPVKGQGRDTLKLFFSNDLCNDINYHISKPIDARYKNRLFHARMILIGFYDDNLNVHVPGMEIFVELKKLAVTKEESEIIIQLVKKSRLR